MPDIDFLPGQKTEDFVTWYENEAGSVGFEGSCKRWVLPTEALQMGAESFRRTLFTRIASPASLLALVGHGGAAVGLPRRKAALEMTRALKAETSRDGRREG